MTVIRSLTLRQPWAWSVVAAGKRTENRSRATTYRGPIAIHAGLRVDDIALQTFPAVVAAVRAWREEHPGQRLVLPSGAIVGVARLASVHEATADCCRPWGERLIYHWVLEDVVPLPEPIPWRGTLGLRKLPADPGDQLLALLP